VLQHGFASNNPQRSLLQYSPVISIPPSSHLPAFFFSAYPPSASGTILLPLFFPVLSVP
jgi:hypothetical protein